MAVAQLVLAVVADDPRLHNGETGNPRTPEVDVLLDCVHVERLRQPSVLVLVTTGSVQLLPPGVEHRIVEGTATESGARAKSAETGIEGRVVGAGAPVV